MNIILLDAYKNKMEFPELKDTAKQFYDEWQPDACINEAKAAGAPLIYELRAMGVHGGIGLTTGRIFCGLVGTDHRREYTFLGNSVNLAARLLGLALRNDELMAQDGVALLCDRPTYEATRDHAEFDVLPPQMVKGRSEPVEVFHPVREKRE